MDDDQGVNQCCVDVNGLVGFELFFKYKGCVQGNQDGIEGYDCGCICKVDDYEVEEEECGCD